MKPKEFVKKYNLDKGWKARYQTDFLNDMTSELLAYLEYNKAMGNLRGFDNAVRALRTKWDSISTKSQFGLPEGMWKYYWATTIAPMREEMCPEQMAARRAEAERRKADREYYKEQQRIFDEELREANRRFWDNLAIRFLVLSALPMESFLFLGLPTNSTEEEIKIRYRELSLKMHPDKGGSQEQFLLLTDHKNRCVKWASLKKTK